MRRSSRIRGLGTSRGRVRYAASADNVVASPSIGADANPTFMHPDGVKRAVIAGLGIAMVSKLTVESDLRRKLLAIFSMKAGLPSRPIVVVDHPQKHHGAACRAMLQALETAFPMERHSTSQ
jgi:DNA-binding transcriptional LysR family regulator